MGNSDIDSIFELNKNDFYTDISLRETIIFYIKEYIKTYEPWISEEWQICINNDKNNRKLSEKRILGLLFLFKKLSTERTVELYNKWFEELSRSTISYYLNGLYKGKVLKKEKDGKKAFFYFNDIARINKANPFWFTKNICPIPRYLYRIAYFARFLYTAKPKKHIEFTLKMIQLNTFNKMFEKCLYCRFSDHKKISEIKRKLNDILENKTNYLSSLMQKYTENYSELHLFDGYQILSKIGGERIPNKIIEFANKNKEEIEYQMKLNKKIDEIRNKIK
ncbi:MAG: hypothetical protein EU549_01425 [Promethearchaeota archaeon]|nr:MAG: hypothetical protein EU549_01425 [Candidatus Lokiarchaeota archaeon]